MKGDIRGSSGQLVCVTNTSQNVLPAAKAFLLYNEPNAAADGTSFRFLDGMLLCDPSSAASLEDPLSTASLDGKHWDKAAKDITIATYKRLCIRSCRVLIRWQNKPRFFFLKNTKEWGPRAILVKTKPCVERKYFQKVNENKKWQSETIFFSAIASM